MRTSCSRSRHRATPTRWRAPPSCGAAPSSPISRSTARSSTPGGRASRRRLAGAAARVFESLCAAADASHDGARALAAAERLVALDPTREVRQRVALTIVARYRGRDAALERARQLTALLRSELDVAPEAATRALIETIRNGEVAAVPMPAPIAPVGLVAAPIAPLGLDPPDIAPTALVLLDARSRVPATLDAPPMPPSPARTLTLWQRRPIAAALAAVTAASFVAIAVAGVATSGRIPFGWFKPKPSAGIATAVVLPFAVDAPRGPQDAAFARLLTHHLTSDLARYGDLRIVAERTADRYPDPQVDVAAVGAELGVSYAVLGRVQRTDAGLRADVQLIDTASRMTLWSDHLQRAGGDDAQLADDVARGLTRVLTINLVYARVAHLERESGEPPPVADLLLRARAAEIHGYRRENVARALALYEAALRRAPNNATAKLGVARMNIAAAMNIVDLDQPPDLTRAEVLVGEVLERFPNWAAAHFTLALLQKYRRQFAAGMKSLQRALELNPSLLIARAQIGALETRMGRPEQGLATVIDTIGQSTANDPALGYYYLFAGEAELELGHAPAALDWVERADTFMPGSPLVQAWLASVYTAMGDQPNAARHIATLKKISPDGAERYAARKITPVPPGGWPRTRILEGLRLALAAAP